MGNRAAGVDALDVDVVLAMAAGGVVSCRCAWLPGEQAAAAAAINAVTVAIAARRREPVVVTGGS